MCNISCGRCSVNGIIQFGRCLVFMNKIIFHPFEAENSLSNSSSKWRKTHRWEGYSPCSRPAGMPFLSMYFSSFEAENCVSNSKFQMKKTNNSAAEGFI